MEYMVKVLCKQCSLNKETSNRKWQSFVTCSANGKLKIWSSWYLVFSIQYTYYIVVMECIYNYMYLYEECLKPYIYITNDDWIENLLLCDIYFLKIKYLMEYLKFPLKLQPYYCENFVDEQINRNLILL